MRRILIIRGGAIGDFILTLPAIKLVRDSITNTHIEVLGYPAITELAVAAGIADSTRSIEHRSHALLFVPGAKLDDALVEWLKSFNVIVSYLHDPDGIVRGNMERIGVRTYLDAPHRVEEGQGHAANQLAKPLESLAMWLDDPAPRIQVANAEARSPRIAVHPGSGSIKKNWSLDHWCRVLHELRDHPLVLITGEAERERGITDAVRDACPDLNIEHWESLPLVELARRLPACSAFLGHDSGISHLAAACGVPCHLFFGPTDPATWAPANENVVVHRVSTRNLDDLSWQEGWFAIRAFVCDRHRLC
ncbi:MAG: glycosyltransferase family 9 protein [Verrucomicrobiaceae bacterium]|nr:glycosyltransferase family 9 protein [Verrucomicrobiaceae bacterium]